jgi:hydroxyacylglutathione hydrolase
LGPGELEVFFDMHDYVAPTLNQYLQDGEVIQAGALKLSVIHTPGHTPGGVSILCDGDLFSGDTLFAGGIGRTDFPGGSQAELMKSIHTRLFALEDNTRVYPGHGPETTIGEEKRSNPWL